MKSAVERRMEIVNVVNQNGKARVEDLAAQFDVSSVTIRSDLSFLEKNGYVVRSHGAAIPNTGVIAELTVHEKRRQNSGVKSSDWSVLQRSLLLVVTQLFWIRVLLREKSHLA